MATASPWCSPVRGISATKPGRRPGQSSNRAANPLLEFLLRLGADLARRELAVLEQHQGRNRHDPVFGRRARVLIDVELDDFHLAIERFGNLFKGRPNHPARPPPSPPEINEDRTACLEHALPKRGTVSLLDHE